MVYKRLLFFLIILSFGFVGYPQKKKAEPLTRVLFILDGSQSMLAQWGEQNKITIAQNLLSNLVDSLSGMPNVELALRVYGHQKPVPPQDCNDTKLEVPFSRNNGNKIQQKLSSVRPKGTTPIAYSLELAANDFPKDADCRNIIVLITDGIESCEGDPCAVSVNLQRQGIILKPFIVGIGLEDNVRETFDCVGRYYNAENADQFHQVLKTVISQALNSTTLQINLLDGNGKPTESNVNMTFYDQMSDQVKYNFIHTINYLGNPDTLRLDPVPVYRMNVHTIPPTIVDSISLVAGQHTIIPVSVPQGTLLVKMQGNQKYPNLQSLVRLPGQIQSLNIQEINQPTKYIAGKYDIEILTVPRLFFDNYNITPDKTTTIEIPQPGLVTFEGSANAYGAIYRTNEKELEMIYQLDASQIVQTIAIQPGNYSVIARPKNAREAVYTFEKTFTVTVGGTIKVVLF